MCSYCTILMADWYYAHSVKYFLWKLHCLLNVYTLVGWTAVFLDISFATNMSFDVLTKMINTKKTSYFNHCLKSLPHLYMSLVIFCDSSFFAYQLRNKSNRSATPLKWISKRFILLDYILFRRSHPKLLSYFYRCKFLIVNILVSHCLYFLLDWKTDRLRINWQQIKDKQLHAITCKHTNFPYIIKETI